MQCLANAGRRFATAKWLPILLAALLLMVALVPLAEASPPPQSPEEGEVLFRQKCAACHTIGRGDRVGPDLLGVTTIREQDWLVRWIMEPDKMLAEKDPIAMELLAQYNNVPMPNRNLSQEESLAVFAYMQKMDAGQAAAPSAAVQLPAGDAQRGRALFTGEASFQSGAPACISCHSVSGVGALGGGALGPDLTQVFDRFGKEGMASVLAAPPFPTMRPIFDGRPLDPQEQSDLIAYLQTTAQSSPAAMNVKLSFISLLLFVIFMVLAHLLWRRRRSGVRRQLVEQAKA